MGRNEMQEYEFEPWDDEKMICPHCGNKFQKKFTDILDLDDELDTDSAYEENDLEIIVCKSCGKPSTLSVKTVIIKAKQIGTLRGIERDEWEKRFKGRTATAEA